MSAADLNKKIMMGLKCKHYFIEAFVEGFIIFLKVCNVTEQNTIHLFDKELSNIKIYSAEPTNIQTVRPRWIFVGEAE